MKRLELAERIIELRESAGLSQGAAAKRAGVGVTTWSNIETGTITRPHARTTIKIARALGVDPEELTDPKARAPLPKQDEGQRRASVLAGAMKAAADTYVRAVADPNLAREQAFGIAAAARILEDFISVQLGDEETWGQLSAQERGDIQRVTQRLDEVDTLCRLRTEDAMEVEALDALLEKSIEGWK